MATEFLGVEDKIIVHKRTNESEVENVKLPRREFLTKDIPAIIFCLAIEWLGTYIALCIKLTYGLKRPRRQVL